MKRKITNALAAVSTGAIIISVVSAAISVAVTAVLLSSGVLSASEAMKIALQHVGILAAVCGVAFLALVCADISKIK